MTENRNPTYINVEPGKSDDLHQVTQYDNLDLTHKHQGQDEETRDQNPLYEQVQEEQEVTKSYDPSEGNQLRQATDYEEIKQDPTKVYDDLQHYHQQEHPYSDLSTK